MASSRERTEWVRWAIRLSVITMVYNLMEGFVSIWFGWADDSIALFGFGVDSLVEVASAALIYWRFRHEAEGASRQERLATRHIGVLFLLLALGTAAGAFLQLFARKHPDTTIPGMIVSLLSLSFMFVLWRSKVRTAVALDSRAMQSDAACSLACIQLSFVLLVGSVLFWLSPRLWWVDASAAIIIALLIAKEGWEGVAASLKADFSGGCGCGHKAEGSCCGE